MKLKTVEIEGKQYAEIDSEGRVLYDNNGEEFAFDAAQTYGKIQELQREAKTNREAKQEMADKLKALDGVDPEKYREAVAALEKLDQKKLLDAGEVDKLRKEIEDGWRQKYETDVGDAQKQLEQLRNQYNGEKLASAFNGSKFIKDNLAVPADMAKATFGDRFKIEDGKLVAVDQSGNTIYSRKNPGAPADFDEAMSQIVESYQYKDSILKASNHQGTGGDGGGGGQKRTITRDQFQSMAPAEQAKMAQAAREGTVQISE
jgi:hypothetical protein